ncbi:MAG TPA: ABC transporter permease [Elusimicrobiota bacterium]|nr:ABC transporter permease [Elusimicrobiota bacterium]
MISFKFSRARSIALKEIRHILRDPFTVALALGLPFILVIFFGYAIDFDMKDIRLTCVDFDQSRASRQLTEIFSESGYFKIGFPERPDLFLQELDQEKTAGVLIVKPDFGKTLSSPGQTAKVQLLLDGADNSKTSAILSYLPGIQRAAAARLTGLKRQEPVKLRTRFLFNPELNSRWFVVPGLATVLIGLISILLTALTVAREWENGSMELLLSTPVRPLEIIVGKILPYVALGLGGVLFVYLAARIGFRVPFHGSHALFIAACLMFIMAGLSQGLLISVVTRQQQLAMQLSMISGLLPSLLLSGFIFPIESMPVFFHYFTAILPPRWFMVIARGIFLKGAGIGELIGPLAALLVMDIVLMTAATKRFKKDLEP